MIVRIVVWLRSRVWHPREVRIDTWDGWTLVGGSFLDDAVPVPVPRLGVEYRCCPTGHASDATTKATTPTPPQSLLVLTCTS